MKRTECAICETLGVKLSPLKTVIMSAIFCFEHLLLLPNTTVTLYSALRSGRESAGNVRYSDGFVVIRQVHLH